jgi:hypothetical protein
MHHGLFYPIIEKIVSSIIVFFNRAFLAFDVVLWFIRLLILLMIDRTVGPMLLMIQAMVGVVGAFSSLI